MNDDYLRNYQCSVSSYATADLRQALASMNAGSLNHSQAKEARAIIVRELAYRDRVYGLVSDE